MRRLGPAFFRRPAPEVARALLGKVLVRTTAAGREERVIVETEAYVGANDLACHASKGCTPRTQVMFGSGGGEPVRCERTLIFRDGARFQDHEDCLGR